jgi:hypothetical protein
MYVKVEQLFDHLFADIVMEIKNRKIGSEWRGF